MFEVNEMISELNNTTKKIKGGYIAKCAQIRPLKKYNVKIPKIIFRTCWSKEIPEKWKLSSESLEALMSEWQNILFDDDDNRAFVEEHFPDFLSYYDAFPYNIQRADAIRYMFLYVYGGLYIDMDFEILNPLDELFVSDNEVYLVKSGNVSSCYTNSFMASKPKCKFWLEVIEEMKKPLPFYIIGKHFTVMCSTGPLMLSRVAKRTSTVIGVTPSKYIMPCNICNINCSTCDSYLRPLEGSSWTGWDTKFFNFWMCYWKVVIIFLISFLLLLLIAWIIFKTGISSDSLWPPSNMFKIFK